MKVELTLNGQQVTVTTEHPSSSYGQPVVLVDGELTDIKASCEPDDNTPSLLTLFADAKGIHKGPQTRAALKKVHDEVLADYTRRSPGWTTEDHLRFGGFYDGVFAEFNRRTKAMRLAESAQ